MKKVSVIGFDMGDKTHKVVALAEGGEVVERIEVSCTPEGVREYLSGHPGALVAMETGTHCRWMCALGVELGHEVLVGHARKLRSIWQSSRKNDWNDAEQLARLARADRKLFHPVRLRSDAAQALLRMVKARDILVRNRTGIVTMIRGFTKADGERLKSCSTESFVCLEFEVPASLRKTTKPLFAMLRELAKKIALYDKMLADALKDEALAADAKLLQTVDGVGPVTTAAYLATVGDAQAFGNARDAGAYFGLAPRQSQSGDIDKQMRISKEGNGLVRRLLVSSAHYILGSFGPDSDLKRHGLRIAERGGKNARKRAVVAVARKLSVVMIAMLKNRTEYRSLSQVEGMA